MQETKILIVEDEPKIADTLQSGLTEKGYAVDVAYDGNIGYRLFKGRKFDLVILDIKLPGINGFELCRWVRAKDANIPIIMVTSLLTLQDKVEGYDSGADDYITKPFEFKELLLKIRALMKRSDNQSLSTDNILKALDLTMNLESKEVKRGGTKIRLTAKEFQLLEYMLRNKNKVISRSEIALNVWSALFERCSNIIDVYINGLHNKIDKPFDQKLIQTTFGVGYVLKDS